MADSSFYRRKRTQAILTWGSALVFVAGVVAVLIVYVGNTSPRSSLSG